MGFKYIMDFLQMSAENSHILYKISNTWWIFTENPLDVCFLSILPMQLQIGSSNGLVPEGSRPLPAPVLTYETDASWQLIKGWGNGLVLTKTNDALILWIHISWMLTTNFI